MKALIKGKKRIIVVITLLIGMAGSIYAFISKTGNTTEAQDKCASISQQDKQLSDASDACMVKKQDEDDHSTLFVGCNGFF